MQHFSIIIPVLNEASQLRENLLALQDYRQKGHELIIVDGGSSDGTPDLARQFCDKFVQTQAGRARQMNAGAQCAEGEVLLFLHADTRLPVNAVELVIEHFNKNKRKVWGRFNVNLSGTHPLLSVVAWFMNVRSCVSGIATGDQGIFVMREYFQQLKGFPEVPIMEDIRLSQSLLQISRPICIKTKLTTSSRRWEHKGIMRTILLMWYLRLAHFLGKSPEELARIYSK